MSEEAVAVQEHEIGIETQLKIYRLMVEARQLGVRAHSLFLEGLVKGSTHMSTGQEAIAAGFGAAMRKEDLSFYTYRGHAHTIARGVGMTEILLELTGRSGGLMNGKGGSMHLTSTKDGVMGCYAIVGAHLPVALGAAWSAQLRGSGQVAVCFFGDGATNIGAFHEALNLASVWKLPVVFVCENNQYMEYTPIREVTAVTNPAADRASAYGLQSILIDGNNADEVYRTARRWIQHSRDGGGPALVEAVTYRHGGHSRGDLGQYRPQAELDAWLARDPLPAYRALLLASGVTNIELQQVEARAAELVDGAERTVREAPPPAAESAMTNLWAGGGAAWRN
jgi:TPP-dependent pyruvate/acetoin dehydrogenase alpha subunit